MRIPRFQFQNESDFALKLGLLFFGFLTLLFLFAAWTALNPRQRGSEITEQIRRYNEWHGTELPVPGESRRKSDHVMAIRYFVAAVMCFSAAALPCCLELRQRRPMNASPSEPRKPFL